MKKILLLFLNLVLIFTLISCNSNSPYNDGLFVGIGDSYSEGNDDCTVTISDGRITDITLRHFDASGKEIDYDEWTGESINGVIKPNLRDYRADFIKEVLDNQTDNIKINNDIPVISNNWKLSLQRALDKAKK